MVPEFDVGCYVNYDPSKLSEITAEDVANYCGPGWNADYEPLYDVTWEDANCALEIEREALDRACQADDAAGFEAALELVTEEAYEKEDDGYFSLIGGFDLGVAGLVMAIVASGGATYTSCRGRAPGSLHLQRHPFVGVALDADRAALISQLVLTAGCCLYSIQDGYLAIGGSSVEHCHRLAKLIVEKRELFDRLSPPSWREGLDELIE
ncbi:hypothetical protein [Nonomuraea sp. NPDC049480]|uniref:hypothetical protein n=1 Tax=Nonomuraea sp. NPDC049480 TaxID=3364353 RepID=UPI00378CAFFA